MENLKMNYVQLVQHKKEIEKRNRKALEYSNRCNKNKDEEVSIKDAMAIYGIGICLITLYFIGCCF